jgi:hypothetical protein
MKSHIRWIALACILLFPGLAMAQSSITCASAPGGGRTYCAADTRGGVTLVAPRGPRVPCNQGVQWGFDAQGIWVQGGCAADFRVQQYRGGPWWWDSGPGNRPAPWKGTGACFYRNVGFDGPYFCMSRGEKIDRLPPGFNDAISSIQVVRARSVSIFSKNGFQGYAGRISDDVANLKQWRIPGTSKSWNNRVSSLRVD